MNNNFIKMATIEVELYNWHSKKNNDNKLIKNKMYDFKYNTFKRCMNSMFTLSL